MKGKWKYLSFVPSLLSQSCLLQAALLGQGLGHRLPGRSDTSAHCRVSQTGCCPAGWHSVSRPAEVRMPLIPEDGGRQMFLYSTKDSFAVRAISSLSLLVHPLEQSFLRVSLCYSFFYCQIFPAGQFFLMSLIILVLTLLIFQKWLLLQ